MLPILVSIPHGGTTIPPEVQDYVRLSPGELFDDSDAFTGEIYDLGPQVAHTVKADTARAVLDPNRAPDDIPPANPDGVVKSHTCHGHPVYHTGRGPDVDLTRHLLARYYEPYHARLRSALEDPRLRLALDCHSMAPTAPAIAPDARARRPMLCLGNQEGRTCPSSLLEELAQALATALDVAERDVQLNDPFKGGYITRTYGVSTIPWIQVEINRAMYLAAPWFNRDTLQVDPDRLAELNDGFGRALHQLVGKLES